MMSNRLLIIPLIFIFFGANAQKRAKQYFTSAPSTSNTADLNTYFNVVKWRNIGPFRGGRSVCASGVVGDINTYYMGTTGGGLWKTEDLGVSWKNISDGFFKTGSVGAVAVSEKDPHVIYIGMGEHAVRGVMTHHGDGVYKSTDAGKTWKKLGLEQTQHISRIAIHPSDPNIVYVAAQGALYGHTKERGIYKSTDGGRTWANILFVDDRTGCVELSMDMNNPRVLYAAMNEFGRLPWRVISGGKGSGLYKTTDGGETWKKIQNALPSELGKMAISVCRSNSNRVYALVESDSEKELGGLFVSTDAGENWTRQTNDHRLVQRAWYYIELYTDPLDELTVYVMNAAAMKSIDGGKTWENVSRTHGDYHDLWINPTNSKNMIVADDGGSAITVNGGQTWSTQYNMPTSQFYRIHADNQFPYKIYAGQQDNSSIVIANRELNDDGITASNWTYTAGGESAFVALNPDSPRYVMGGSYQGTINVLDTQSGITTNIMAAPIQYLSMDAKDMRYRYNWNAPIICSSHEPHTFYHGAQLLLRTTDMGMTWTEVSPDLTRNNKAQQGRPGVPYTNEAVGAENYGTLSYVIESPHEKGVIWTGSDDGLVHLTKDGGKTWKNVTPTGLPECLINAIEVSPHDRATAYIATTRYKFNDHTPGLYKTTDYGLTWSKITNGIPPQAFTRVVREDQHRKELLFAGTELGIFVSWNGGKQWHSFQLNLPITPITDLKVHQNDLIASTSGRSFWLLDDLSLIRQYQEEQTSFKLFQPEPSILINSTSEMDNYPPGFNGTHTYRGVNPASGIVVYYQLPEMKETDLLEMRIEDTAGNLVNSFTSVQNKDQKKYDGGPALPPVLTKAKGLNRFVWDLRYPSMKGAPNVYLEQSYAGHFASPGKYKLTLRYANLSAATEIEIRPNPHNTTDAKTYREYNELMLQMESEVNKMHTLVSQLYTIAEQLEKLLNELPQDAKYATVHTGGNALLEKMKQFDNEMVQRKTKAYDDPENYPNKFTSNYIFMINQLESINPKITKATLAIQQEMNAQWKVLQDKANQILHHDIPLLNKQLWELGVGAIWVK